MGTYSATSLRITLLAPRAAAAADSWNSSVAVSSLGMLRDGCKVQPAWAVVPEGAAGPDGLAGATGAAGQSAAASLTVAFGNLTRGNGYYFVLSLLPPRPVGALDGSLRWTVEASCDGGASWVPVGASAWRINQQAYSVS